MPDIHVDAIRPYVPSSDIDWEAASLELTPWLDHKDDAIQREFHRFIRRDIQGFLIGFMYLVGASIYKPLRILDNGDLYFMNIIASALAGALFVPDAILHLFFDNTARVAQVRSLLQVLLPIAGVITTTASTDIGYSRCEFTTDWFAAIGLPRPELTAERIGLFCDAAISPYVTVTVTLAIAAIVTPPKAIWLSITVMIALLIVSRFLGTFPNETPEQLAVRIAMYAAVFISVVGIMLLRFKLVVTQFHQAVQVAKSSRKAEREAQEVDLLLCAMVPISALMRLSAGETVLDYTDEATVLFSDMVQFTAWSSKRSAQEVVRMLNVLCVEFDLAAEKHGIEKIKTIGDAYWAVSGLPDSHHNHASVMCEFASTMLTIVDEQNVKHPEWHGVQLRIGVHSGELWGGILGTQQLSYEVFGVTNTVAEECEKNGVPGRLVISNTTRAAALLFNERHVQTHKSFIHDGIEYELFIVRRDVFDTVQRSERSPVFSPKTRNSDTPLGDGFSDSGRKLSLSMSQLSASKRSAGLHDVEHRKMREKFLKKQAEKNAEMEIEQTLEDIEDRYSTRRWNWCLMGFSDPEVEAQYLRFVAKLQLPLRRFSRVATLLLIAVIVFSIGLEDGSYSIGSAVCFPLATATVLLDFGLSFKETTDPRIQAALHNVAVIVIALAAGLVPAGSSVATNDITYLHPPLTLFLSVGNVGLVPVASLVLFNMCVYVPVMIAMIWRTVLISGNTLVMMQTNVTFLYMMFVIEKQYRRQFLERQVAQHFEASHAQRRMQRAGVLKAIVPAHVIDPLMLWMGDGMDIHKSMVETYDRLCVGFIKLSAPTGHASDGSVDGENLFNGIHREKHEWLTVAIAAVDKILQKYPAVVKIKTIGENVMIAGPLDAKYTVAQMADQALAAVSELRSLTTITVGFHCGPIVGAILGTNRLCFDIFGDSVNTASRAMSTGGVGDVTVTAEFYEAFIGAEEHVESIRTEPDEILTSPQSPKAFVEEMDDMSFFHCCQGVAFSEPVERIAKGKGAVQMRTVTKFPIVQIAENSSM